MVNPLEATPLKETDSPPQKSSTGPSPSVRGWRFLSPSLSKAYYLNGILFVEKKYTSVSIVGGSALSYNFRKITKGLPIFALWLVNENFLASLYA